MGVASTPKAEHSFLGFWCRGGQLAVKAAWSRYGNATRLGGLVAVLLGLTVATWLGSQLMGIELKHWITAVIPLGVLVLGFFYALARAPYEMYLELVAKHDAAKAEMLQEIARLKRELHEREVNEIRQEATRDRLRIDDLDLGLDVSKKYGIDISIRNTSKRTADDVTVELLKITAEEPFSLPSRGVKIMPTTELGPLHSEGVQQFRLAVVYFSVGSEDGPFSATLKIFDSPQNHYLKFFADKEYCAVIRVGARDFGARTQRIKFQFRVTGSYVWFEFLDAS